MALQTRAQVDTTISTDFGNNTTGDISAQDLREGLTDLADSALFVGDAETRVIDMVSTAPPGSPGDRDAYVVAATATGAWAGEEDSIAVYDLGATAWVFIAPTDGAAVWNIANDQQYRWDADASPPVWTAYVPAASIDKATAANIRAGAADKVITADGVESALELVTLSDAATIAVDWATFINGSVTITAGRTLGNPTNGEPGTTRTVLVVQDGTGGHTLAFDTQYLHPGGAAPTITATASAVDMLQIYCRTATEFLVTFAQDFS